MQNLWDIIIILFTIVLALTLIILGIFGLKERKIRYKSKSPSHFSWTLRGRPALVVSHLILFLGIMLIIGLIIALGRIILFL